MSRKRDWLLPRSSRPVVCYLKMRGYKIGHGKCTFKRSKGHQSPHVLPCRTGLDTSDQFWCVHIPEINFRARTFVSLTTAKSNHINKPIVHGRPHITLYTQSLTCLTTVTMTTQQSWPPACRSALSVCTCCCILTPHTHLSDSAGYPHLNHIIRFPKSDNSTAKEIQVEVLAWFHCPHCPCTLGITWIHPKEMSVVEESVRSASWLPRVADFKEYNRLFEEEGHLSPTGCESPMMTDEGGPTSSSSSCSPAQGGILGDRTNMLEEMVPSTPVVQRKLAISNTGPRKSARKTKPSARSAEVNKSASPTETPPYKPRRSKYDIP
jgi:hypothetical protein